MDSIVRPCGSSSRPPCRAVPCRAGRFPAMSAFADPRLRFFASACPIATTATGRKLFRVGKSLNEIDTLRGILAKGDEGDAVKYYLQITKQLAFMTYWFFDNIGFGIRAK